MGLVVITANLLTGEINLLAVGVLAFALAPEAVAFGPLVEDQAVPVRAVGAIDLPLPFAVRRASPFAVSREVATLDPRTTIGHSRGRSISRTS